MNLKTIREMGANKHVAKKKPTKFVYHNELDIEKSVLIFFWYFCLGAEHQKIYLYFSQIRCKYGQMRCVFANIFAEIFKMAALVLTNMEQIRQIFGK